MNDPSLKNCRLYRGLLFRLAALILTTLVTIVSPRFVRALPETRVISVTGNLNFGNVLIGSSVQRTMKISNTGNSPLTVLGIDGPPQPVLLLGGYNTDWTWSGTILPGRSHELTVTFTPGGITVPNNTNPVEYPGSLTVVSDATSGTGTIQVSGTGVVPPVTRIISVSANLNFGKTPIRSISPLNLVIANKGNSDLTISNINFPDGFNTFVFDTYSGFGLPSGSTNVTIPAGGRTNINVTFYPTNVAHYGGTATIDSDATSGKGEFTVSGEGAYPAGHFVGLFSSGMGPPFVPASTNAAFGDSGYFSANVTANGSFSGVLLLAGTRQPFSGRFSPSGAFSGLIGSGLSLQIIPGGGNTLGASFQLIGPSWHGVISNGEAWSANLFAYTAIPHLINELPPGKYHFDIAGSTDPLLAPTNNGTGTIQLTESGTAHVSGTLGDGTPFSQDTTLVLRQLPFYASLYHSQGAVMGWITCEVLPTNLLVGLTNRVPLTNEPPIVVTNVPPLTNFPVRTNPVVIITNIPPVIITNFPPFTNTAPVTNIPVLLSSRITLVPDDLSRAQSVAGSSPTSSGTNSIGGSINWFKPPQIDSNYPDGFSFQTTVNGPTE